MVNNTGSGNTKRPTHMNSQYNHAQSPVPSMDSPNTRNGNNTPMPEPLENEGQQKHSSQYANNRNTWTPKGTRNNTMKNNAMNSSTPQDNGNSQQRMPQPNPNHSMPMSPQEAMNRAHGNNRSSGNAGFMSIPPQGQNTTDNNAHDNRESRGTSHNKNTRQETMPYSVNDGYSTGRNGSNPNNDTQPAHSMPQGDNTQSQESHAHEDKKVDSIVDDGLDQDLKLVEELKKRTGGVSRRESRNRDQESALEALRQASKADAQIGDGFIDDVTPITRIKNLTQSQENDLLADIDNEAISDNSDETILDDEVIQEVDITTPTEANEILGLVSNAPTPTITNEHATEVDEEIERLSSGLQASADDKEAMNKVAQRIKDSSAHTNSVHNAHNTTVTSNGNTTENNHSGDDGNNKNHDDKPSYTVDSAMTIIEPDQPIGIPFTSKRKVEEMFNEAVKLGASDIHMTCDRPVKLRINGSLYSWGRYEILVPKVLNSFVAGDMSLLNHEMTSSLNVNKSVDLAYTLPDEFNHERFRMHVMDTSGEVPGFVLRRIDPVIRTPEESMIDSTILSYGNLSQGLILVTGPTGSGKSSLLATILREVQANQPKKIITLEEPIETIYPVDGKGDIVQREVPENCKTFARGIRDAMREDPDIILVGEIRDYDTIEAALQACNTGHLTFATIHANSAPDVITRILDLAGENANKEQLKSDLARNLKCVISQRLLLKSDNRGRIPVREVIHVGGRQKIQIQNGDVDGLMLDLKRDGLDLDSQMIELMLKGETTLKAARNASTERETFDSRLAIIPKILRDNIIIDVDHTMEDNDLEYQDEDNHSFEWYDELLS